MWTVMTDLDDLLGASDGFLFGRWVAGARRLAPDTAPAADVALLEMNARAQVGPDTLPASVTNRCYEMDAPNSAPLCRRPKRKQHCARGWMQGAPTTRLCTCYPSNLHAATMPLHT